MSILNEQRLKIFQMKNTLWMLTKPTGIGVYDFEFEKFFECRHHWRLPTPLTTVARIGAVENYEELYDSLTEEGISLIHTPEQYQRCGELPNWYPLISELTPRSIWFDELPTAHEITDHFEFPIFVKGARQTSKHNKNLSIIENIEMLDNLLKAYAKDPILHWQRLVCREYVELMPVGKAYSNQIHPPMNFVHFGGKVNL